MKNIFLLTLLGALAGIVCGLLGVGGGVVLILIFTHYLKLEQHFAQAITIMVIFASAFTSSLSYYFSGHLNFSYILFILIGSAIGSWLGAHALRKLPTLHLKALFAVFMLAAGVRMLW